EMQREEDMPADLRSHPFQPGIRIGQILLDPSLDRRAQGDGWLFGAQCPMQYSTLAVSPKISPAALRAGGVTKDPSSDRNNPSRSPFASYACSSRPALTRTFPSVDTPA